MSLAEIMPAIRQLSREEQVELVRVLTAELSAVPPSPADRDAELLQQLVAAAPCQLDRPWAGPVPVETLRQLLADRWESTN
jgi:hypothetical protein